MSDYMNVLRGVRGGKVENYRAAWPTLDHPKDRLFDIFDYTVYIQGGRAINISPRQPSGQVPLGGRWHLGRSRLKRALRKQRYWPGPNERCLVTIETTAATFVEPWFNPGSARARL